MDDSRRQLLTAAVVAALIGGGFFAFDYFQKGGAPGEQSAADTDGARETDASEEVTEGDGRPDAAAMAERKARAREVRIATDTFEAVLTNLNTGLKSLTLKGERFLDDDGEPHQMVTTDSEALLPLILDLRGVGVPADAVWEVVGEEPDAVTFRWSGKGFAVTREIATGDGPYQLWSTLRITNESEGERPVRPVVTTHHYVTNEDAGGGMFFARPSPEASKAICHYGDETAREAGDDLIEAGSDLTSGAMGFGAGVRWTGIENVYFAQLLAPSKGTAERCQLEGSSRGGTIVGDEIENEHGKLYTARLVYPRAELAPGESQTWRTLAYFGPKDHDALAAAGHQLTEAVDLGWFDWIAEWLVALLRWIHSVIGNWGLAIILLTVLVKLVLYPLTEKSFQSMAKMRQLKPEMDRINELYADDREKKGMAMMELYRKHKINPLGGCLPTLLQLPIWFALYQSLSTNVELYHAPFALWWGDLSSPDPYYVLPLTLGALMFLQQRFTPTTMDATQAKVMMYFMPVMITVFMLFLPAGLCLYMVTNSTLGIAQQRWIQYRLERSEASTANEDENEDEEPGQDDGSSEPESDATKGSSSSRIKPKAAKKTSRGKSRGGKRRQRRG